LEDFPKGPKSTSEPKRKRKKCIYVTHCIHLFIINGKMNKNAKYTNEHQSNASTFRQKPNVCQMTFACF